MSAADLDQQDRLKQKTKKNKIIPPQPEPPSTAAATDASSSTGLGPPQAVASTVGPGSTDPAISSQPPMAKGNNKIAPIAFVEDAGIPLESCSSTTSEQIHEEFSRPEHIHEEFAPTEATEAQLQPPRVGDVPEDSSSHAPVHEDGRPQERPNENEEQSKKPSVQESKAEWKRDTWTDQDSVELQASFRGGGGTALQRYDLLG